MFAKLFSRDWAAYLSEMFGYCKYSFILVTDIGLLLIFGRVSFYLFVCKHDFCKKMLSDFDKTAGVFPNSTMV